MINIIGNIVGGNTPTGAAGGPAPIDPSEITAIADFHVIGNDAVVDGSNVLTSWQERVSASNLNIQGASLATIPNLVDSHRAVSLNGTNQGFYFPVTPFQSFYVVRRFFRHPTDGAWRLFHTSQANANFTDTDFWRENFPNNQHQVGRSGVSGGVGFNMSAFELTATSAAGVLVIQAYKNLTTFITNGVTLTSGGFAHVQTISDSTYTQIGYKAEGDNASAFSFLKADILEMIGFSTQVTDEQHDLVMTYLAEQYPSIT